VVNKSRETELETEGWTKQFTVDEPRLSEAIEMYKLLGFEVHLEPMVPDESSEECAACLEVMYDRYKTVYTRPAEGGESEKSLDFVGLYPNSGED
jgi:hypothetical protein